jgi:hypothetical protein
MLKERRLAAESVAEQLFAAEAAIDAAIAAVARLTATMPQARLDANLAPMIGHDALMKASQTCASLVEARAGICATHEALAIAQKQIGLGAVAFGSLVKLDMERKTSIRAVDASEQPAVRAA